MIVLVRLIPRCLQIVHHETCYIPHNDDDDDESGIADKLETPVEGEDDLRYAKLYAWVEYAGSYTFDVYQNHQETGKVVELWLDEEKNDLLAATHQNTVQYAVGDFILTGRITYAQDDPVRHAMMTVHDTGLYTTEIARFFTNKDGYYLYAFDLADKDKIDYIYVHAYSDTLAGGRAVSTATNTGTGYTDAYSVRFFDAYHDSSDTTIRNNAVFIL